MAKSKSAKERLGSIVVREKISAIESMLAVLKSETYKLLTNFMYLNEQDLKVYIDVTQSGEYHLSIRAVSDKLIDVGRILR